MPFLVETAAALTDRLGLPLDVGARAAWRAMKDEGLHPPPYGVMSEVLDLRRKEAR